MPVNHEFIPIDADDRHQVHAIDFASMDEYALFQKRYPRTPDGCTPIHQLDHAYGDRPPGDKRPPRLFIWPQMRPILDIQRDSSDFNDLHIDQIRFLVKRYGLKLDGTKKAGDAKPIKPGETPERNWHLEALREFCKTAAAKGKPPRPTCIPKPIDLTTQTGGIVIPMAVRNLKDEELETQAVQVLDPWPKGWRQLPRLEREKMFVSAQAAKELIEA